MELQADIELDHDGEHKQALPSPGCTSSRRRGRKRTKVDGPATFEDSFAFQENAIDRIEAWLKGTVSGGVCWKTIYLGWIIMVA